MLYHHMRSILGIEDSCSLTRAKATLYVFPNHDDALTTTTEPYGGALWMMPAFILLVIQNILRH
jgi:hypothetical protein